MTFLLESILHFLGCCGVALLYGLLAVIILVLIDILIIIIKDIYRRLRK